MLCLISISEKWKRSADKGKNFCCPSYRTLQSFWLSPIIAKLNAYGFCLSAARLMQSYLSNRKQRAKINTAYNSWKEILFRVPKGSILGLLLLNIFICDLHSFLPHPLNRGVCFWNLDKEGAMKKLLRNRGLIERRGGSS